MSNKIKCDYCGKEYSIKGIGTHIWRTHGEGINHKTTKNNTSWNKGLTKNNNESVKKQSETLKNNIQNGKIKLYWKGKKHKPETIKKMKQNCGGIRKGSGRGKSGWYKGYWCDSSWELAYVIYNLEHNINFKRNKQGFEYIFENKKYKYYPDFILEDGTYIEIKGYLNNKNKEKIKQFKHNLIIIDKTQIKQYLNYSIDKYGKNFIELYENSINKKKKNNQKISKNDIKNIERKKLIKNSNIDFSKYGWGQELSKLLNITSQKAILWVKNHMIDEIDFYFSH